MPAESIRGLLLRSQECSSWADLLTLAAGGRAKQGYAAVKSRLII